MKNTQNNNKKEKINKMSKRKKSSQCKATVIKKIKTTHEQFNKYLLKGAYKRAQECV